MSSLQYPWPETPQPGTTLEVAPGVHWISMPLPFQLDHINLWLLQDEGGWLNRPTAQRFADFVQLVVRRLGDRVPRWITHNETFEHSVFGHALGVHAPGLQLGLGLFPVGHLLLLSHGLAGQAQHHLRERELSLRGPLDCP